MNWTLHSKYKVLECLFQNMNEILKLIKEDCVKFIIYLINLDMIIIFLQILPE